MKKIFFLSLLSFSVPFAALAVTVSDNITLSLGSDSYTLETDSSFNTLTINSNNFVFLLDSNQGVKLRSSDRRNLANDQSVQVECTSSQSRLVYQAPAGGSSVTLTVTPSGTCSSGGGGGGGGGGSSAPAPTSAPSTTPAPAPAPPPSPAPISFTRDLALGSTGDDVTQLQALLASDASIYPEGMVTGYFGGLTQAAVRRFQAKYGLPQVGRGGEMTRAKLVEVFGSGQAPAPTPAPAGPSSSALSRELQMGMSGDDVRALQEFLAKDSAIYPEGIVSGYYGSLTRAAVRRFQAKYGIAQVGRVGPLTLAKLQELMAQ